MQSEGAFVDGGCQRRVVAESAPTVHDLSQPAMTGRARFVMSPGQIVGKHLHSIIVTGRL
jgi:hypothetical protein